jgi:hypothetical protein
LDAANTTYTDGVEALASDIAEATTAVEDA